MSNLIVFNYFSIAVLLSKWESTDTTSKINFRSHYSSPWIMTLCVCMCYCMNMCSCEGVLCVYVPVSLPCGLNMVTMRTAWLVTSLQQCDIIARWWLILLAHFCVCVRERGKVCKCVKMLREGTQQQSLSTSMCFILCNKNNYIVFVLGV